MPGMSAVVFLLAGVLSLWIVARLFVLRADPTAATASGTRLLAAAAVGVLLAIAGNATSSPQYAAAAGVAAIAAAAAIGVRLEVGRAYRAPAHAIPSLAHRPPGTPGTISAAAALTGAAAAFASAALAYRLRLLGPSDPALVALAAYLGMMFDCWLEGVWAGGSGRRAVAAVAAAIVAALIGTLLVVLLP